MQPGLWGLFSDPCIFVSHSAGTAAFVRNSLCGNYKKSPPAPNAPLPPFGNSKPCSRGTTHPCRVMHGTEKNPHSRGCTELSALFPRQVGRVLFLIPFVAHGIVSTRKKFAFLGAFPAIVEYPLLLIVPGSPTWVSTKPFISRNPLRFPIACQGRACFHVTGLDRRGLFSRICVTLQGRNYIPPDGIYRGR